MRPNLAATEVPKGRVWFLKERRHVLYFYVKRGYLTVSLGGSHDRSDGPIVRPSEAKLHITASRTRAYCPRISLSSSWSASSAVSCAAF